MCLCNPFVRSIYCENCIKFSRNSDNLDLSKVKEGSIIKYIGLNIFKFESETYTVYKNKDTYPNIEDCPVEEREQLVIIEILNNNPIFINVNTLNLKEWKLIDG